MPRDSLARTVGLLAVALCAGCSSAGGPVATSGAETPPATMTVGPLTIASIDSRMVATIDVANPDGMVALDGAIWVKTDDGRVVRIDQRRNTVTGEVQLDTATDASHYCQEIGTDGEAVWACAATDSATGIARVDPETLASSDAIPVDKIFGQLTLPHTTRGIWVLTGTGSTLRLVDPGSAATTDYELPTPCTQLAASDVIVVASCPRDGLVVRVDPATGQVLGQAILEEPGVAAVAGDDVWVDTANGLTRLDSELSIRAVYPEQVAGPDGDVAIDAGEVWVRGSGSELWRIDAATGIVEEHLRPEAPLSGGSLLLTADAIWATANDDGLVVRIAR